MKDQENWKETCTTGPIPLSEGGASHSAKIKREEHLFGVLTFSSYLTNKKLLAKIYKHFRRANCEGESAPDYSHRYLSQIPAACLADKSERSKPTLGIG